MNQQLDRVAEQIREMAEAWADAERRNDADGLARILADDFVGVGPRGFLLTRDQWLARYRSGDLKNESFIWQDASARVHGETAIVIGRQTTRGTYQGHPLQGDFRTMLVF